MRRAFTITLASLAIMTLLVGVSEASAAEKYKSCRQLHADYVFGLAQDQAASGAVQAAGFRVPSVGKKAYVLNRHLDDNGNKVACEVKAKTPAPAPSPTAPVAPSVIYISTGSLFWDALWKSAAETEKINQGQATFLSAAMTVIRRQVLDVCPLWGVPAYRTSFLSEAAGQPVVDTYKLPSIEWTRTQVELAVTLACADAGFK